MIPEIRIRLCIPAEKISGEEITRFLGRKPTSCKKGYPLAKAEAWSLYNDFIKSYYIDEYLAKFIKDNRLFRIWHKLKEISSIVGPAVDDGVGAHISCDVFVDDEMPGMYVSSETLRFFVEAGLDLKVDIIRTILSDDEPPFSPGRSVKICRRRPGAKENRDASSPSSGTRTRKSHRRK